MPKRRASWEPWHPALGQRVRVRLSGECDFRPTLEPFTHWRGHPAAFNGVEGVIVDEFESPYGKNPHTDHPYIVRFDRGLPIGQIVMDEDGFEYEMAPTEGVFAAIELEPARP